MSTMLPSVIKELKEYNDIKKRIRELEDEHFRIYQEIKSLTEKAEKLWQKISKKLEIEG